MTRQLLSILAAALTTVALTMPALAQQPATPPSGAPVPVEVLPESPPRPTRQAQNDDPALVPLEVTVTISRHKDDKELSRMPYAMAVTANERQGASVRMGLDVPTPATGSMSGSVPVISYQPVGVNIDCSAYSEGSRFRLSLTVNNDSIHAGTERPTESATDPPIVRHFMSNTVILLADGDTREFTAATDPVTGEVVRISVALRVVE